MSVQRSASTRRHPSGRAGAGEYVGGIDGCGHEDSGKQGGHHAGYFAAAQQKYGRTASSDAVRP